MRKAQISTEYIILVGFLLTILFPTALLAMQTYKESEILIYSRQAEQAATAIVKEAESVYYQGPPSMSKIKIYLPENIDEIKVSERELIISIRRAEGIDDIVISSLVNLFGSIENRKGTQEILLITDGEKVIIG